MANFELISHRLEGALNNQLNLARSGQGVWEWYNALKRIVSANYVTNTATMYGPATVADSDFVVVEADAATLYGVLIDNSNAAEAVWVTVLDGDASDTPGTEHLPGPGPLYVPAATMRTFLWPSGIDCSAAGIAVYAGTGTDAGLEAGTAVTGTNPTIIAVFTTA